MREKELFFKLLLVSVMLLMTVTGRAQSHGNRLSLGFGALYESGLDATLAVEHETKNHNAWEYFANGYVKWTKDEKAGHVTKDSFWNNYRTWGLGIAYKPCVTRSRNKYGSLRLGASAGSDTHEFVGWAHVATNTTMFSAMAGISTGRSRRMCASMVRICSVQDLYWESSSLQGHVKNG